MGNLETTPVVHRHELLFCQFVFLLGSLQVLPGGQVVLETKWKGSPVHSHRLPWLYLLMYNHRLLWVDVLKLEELAGRVCANRDDWQIEAPELFAYLLENITVPRVARVEYLLALCSLNHEPSPKPLIFIKEASPAPMADRHKGDAELLPSYLEISFLRPVQSLDQGFFGEHSFGVQSCKK